MVYEMMMRKKCVLCDSPANEITSVFNKAGNYVRVMSNSIEVHNLIGVCKYCGLVQTINPMTEEALNRFYKKPEIGESPYRSLYPFSEQAALGHLRDALGFIGACMEESYANGKPFYNSSILDLGSGGTWSLDHLIKAFEGSRVCTYDPGVVSNLKGVLPNLDNEKFDIIICLNVLEHVYNPVTFLEDLKEHLTDNGRIILSVPDIYAINIAVGAWFSGAHLWHFSSDLVGMLILRAGYRITHSMSTLDHIGGKIFIDIQKSEQAYKGSYKYEPINALVDYISNTYKADKSRNEIFDYLRDNIKKEEHG